MYDFDLVPTWVEFYLVCETDGDEMRDEINLVNSGPIFPQSMRKLVPCFLLVESGM